MTYRPMLTEPRYVRDAETSAVSMKHTTSRQIEVPAGEGTAFEWQEDMPRRSWAGQVQELLYAADAEAYSSEAESLFMKETAALAQAGALSPLSEGVIPQAKTYSEIAGPELSDLYCVPQAPWFSCDTIGCIA